MYPTGELALATHDSSVLPVQLVKFPSMLTGFFPVFLTLPCINIKCQMLQKVPEWGKFQSKKCRLWQKKQKLYLLLSPPSFNHFGCGFRKAQLISVSSQACRKNRYHSSPVFPGFCLNFRILWPPKIHQLESEEQWPSVWMHLIGLWMEIQSKTSQLQES